MTRWLAVGGLVWLFVAAPAFAQASAEPAADDDSHGRVLHGAVDGRAEAGAGFGGTNERTRPRAAAATRPYRWVGFTTPVSD